MAIQDDIDAYNAGLRDVTSQTLSALNEISSATTRSKTYMAELARTTASMASSDKQLVSSLIQVNALSKSQARDLSKQLTLQRGIKAARIAEINVSRQQRTITENHVKILKSGGPISAMRGNMKQLKQEAKEWGKVGTQISRGNLAGAVGTTMDKSSDYMFGFADKMSKLYKNATEEIMKTVSQVAGAKTGKVVKFISDAFEEGQKRRTETSKYKLSAAKGGGLGASGVTAGDMFVDISKAAKEWGKNFTEFNEEINKTAQMGVFHLAQGEIITFEDSVQTLAAVTGQSTDSIRQSLAQMSKMYKTRGEDASSFASRFSKLTSGGNKYWEMGLGNMEDFTSGIMNLADSFSDLNLDTTKVAKNTLMYSKAMSGAGGKAKDLWKAMSEIQGLGNIAKEWKGAIGMMSGMGTDFFGAQFGYEQRKGGKQLGVEVEAVQQQKAAFSFMEQMTSGMVGPEQQGMMEMMGQELNLSPQSVQLMQQAAQEGWSDMELNDALEKQGEMAKETVSNLNSLSKQIQLALEAQTAQLLVKGTDLIISAITNLSGYLPKILTNTAAGQDITKAMRGAQSAGAGAASGSSWLGGLKEAVLGAKAEGGNVAGGRSILVGEKGPEIFQPGSSGRIIPNGGSGGMSNNFNITVVNDARGIAKEIEAKIISSAYAQRESMMGAS